MQIERADQVQECQDVYTNTNQADNLNLPLLSIQRHHRSQPHFGSLTKNTQLLYNRAIFSQGWEENTTLLPQTSEGSLITSAPFLSFFKIQLNRFCAVHQWCPIYHCLIKMKAAQCLGWRPRELHCSSTGLVRPKKSRTCPSATLSSTVCWGLREELILA